MMPSVLSRAAYLRKVAPSLSEKERARWVGDTEGFSVAHLKELAAAVLCLDYEYKAVLERLRKMIKGREEVKE